jgi:hypothetical protein
MPLDPVPRKVFPQVGSLREHETHRPGSRMQSLAIIVTSRQTPRKTVAAK